MQVTCSSSAYRVEGAPASVRILKAPWRELSALVH
jgi:hypothetical protein